MNYGSFLGGGEMKKIIRITTVSDSLWGLLSGQLRFLNEHFEVIGVASGKERLASLEMREGIRVREIKMKRGINLVQDLFSLCRLIVLFFLERPYVVHANTPKASLLSMVAAWLMRVPHRIYTVTGLRFETTSGNFRKLLIFMEKLTCWCATKVIPEGEGVKDTLLREKITAKPLNIVLNGSINGIDIQHFRLTDLIREQALKIRIDAKFTYCFVGRLVRDKGINELIHSFIRINEIYPNTHLLLVGPFEKELDPLLPEVENQILNHTSISYVGFQKDIRPYLAASELLVLPSYREGFPNVVLQAGAMGLPAIVTDINGSNEIILNRVNGVIIPAQNENALFDAMQECFLCRNGQMLLMAKHARPMIVDRFEQKRVWESLLKEYKSLDNM